MTPRAPRAARRARRAGGADTPVVRFVARRAALLLRVPQPLRRLLRRLHPRRAGRRGRARPDAGAQRGAHGRGRARGPLDEPARPSRTGGVPGIGPERGHRRRGRHRDVLRALHRARRLARRAARAIDPRVSSPTGSASAVAAGHAALVVGARRRSLRLPGLDEDRALRVGGLVAAAAVAGGDRRVRARRVPADGPARLDRTTVRHAHARAHAGGHGHQHRPRHGRGERAEGAHSTSTRSARSSSRRWRARSPAPLTGLLINLVWTYLAPPPFGSPYAAPFAIVAVVIGLMAGTFAGWVGFAPGRRAPDRALVVGGLGRDRLIVPHGVARPAGLGGARLVDPSCPRPATSRSSSCWAGWPCSLVVGTTVGLAHPPRAGTATSRSPTSSWPAPSPGSWPPSSRRPSPPVSSAA